MNVSTKLIISALGLCALPLAQAAEFEDFGKVVRVQPRIEQVRVPRQECRTDYVQAPVQQQRGGGGGGAIIGGLVGGLLGNQVGSGNGRSVATAAGAIAGAVVGNNTEANSYNNQPQQVQEQAVQRCRNVDAYEERTNGYDVTYEYRGRNYTEVMRRDPGQRIRLRVSAVPAEN
ncbi:MAG: glycine zipper 2TM domain-containing protein [Proteobacteria bacterium]|nr:MAG: glycine zipper 2TM domain-containing protein [Pseudomonadota bacterium]